MARKEKHIHYLYKTTCLVTNRYYIGMHSTCNLDDGYMGSGKRLRYSIRKYGVDNHVREILEFFESRELLIEAEIKSITPEMIQDKDCMNLMCGGTGGFTLEIQKLGKKAWLLKYSGTTQQSYWSSQGGKAKYKKYGISEKFKPDWFGRKHSEETKEKISESKKGTGTSETNSQYGTCWITKNGLNKKIKKEELENNINEGWVKGRKYN